MARVVAVGLPHHVTQRGNQRRDIFLREAQKRVYLELLEQHAHNYRLRILAYCFMTNHLHLVAIPDREDSMAGALRQVHGLFAQYWNTELRQVGHMWQNRYYSCPMEPARVWSVVRYVELNPVRAGMAGEAVKYEWSSAAAHCGGHHPSGLLDLGWWRDNWTEGEWSECLRRERLDSSADEIRKATYTGRPLGSVAFQDRLGRQLGRRLTPAKGGLPKKVRPEVRQLTLAGK